MTRPHAEEMRAWIAQWDASTPAGRRAELERLDALGYANAREAAAAHIPGDFGSPSSTPAPVAAIEPAPTPTDDPKDEIASFKAPPETLPPAPPPPLVAYTDGSGTVAHLPCGAGVVVFDGDEVVLEASRHLGNGTNNHAELSAIRVALAITNTPEWRGRHLIVRSDSMYAIGAVTAPRGPLATAANAQLIYEVRKLLGGRLVTFEHVKGHSGIAGNERADKLAGLARTRPQAALRRAG